MCLRSVQPGVRLESKTLAHKFVQPNSATPKSDDDDAWAGGGHRSMPLQPPPPDQPPQAPTCVMLPIAEKIW